MALTYKKDIRDLSIKGTITTNTGVQIHLTPDEIINYSFDSQIGSEGLPLGSAESSSFSLEFSNLEHAYTPSMFDNAEVHMFIGIHDGSDYVYSDFGVWYVDTSTAPEQSVSISLSGYDALATRFEDYFVDSKGAYPTTIGRIATDVCLASGIRLKTADFPNAGVVVSKMPTWDEEATLRDVLSYCAICAGGYVRIARNGQVEIVGFMDGQTYELDPDSYHTFTLTGGTAFKFNAIEAMLSEDAEEYTRYAVNSNIASDATNTIQIEYNPLLTDAILQSITTELSGIEIEAGTITWGGDPSVECTDYYEVTMLDGTVRKIMVTSQNFSFDGGLSVTESCDLPAKNAVGSPTYSTSTNMYDAKGRIKASRIPGLDKQVISATVGHFDQLTADTAEFDELLAAYINAINLLVDKIDANAIKAGTITADKIDAKALDAVSLEAITAKIESLTADDIDTDRLAAALADFTVVTAGSAVFDRTTVQHLIASALNVRDAVGENVFIENLSIRDAQIVGATVGTLCIKASNGRYYNIDVDPKTGNIISTDVTETINATDVEAGVTPDGKRVIIETSITADELNAVSLKAVHALINSIDAACIDADEFFAREAVIDRLRTAKIVNDKSITVIAGEVEDLDRMSSIEVIEGTFARAVRREGEGIRIYSEIEPKQDLSKGNPSPDNICPIEGRTDLHANCNNLDYIANFDETVYGGKVDWNAGEMTVEWGTYVLTGEGNAKLLSASVYNDKCFMSDVIPGAVGNSTILNGARSSHFVEGVWNDIVNMASPFGKFAINTSNKIGIAYDGTIDEANAWLAAQHAAGTPVQFAYKLAEPYTIRFAPVQIASVKGINTVYTDADGGRVEFGYNLLENTVDTLEDTVKGVQAIANDALPKVDFQRVVRIDEEGLHVGDNKTSNEVLIDTNSVNVVMSGQKYSRFTADYVQFGDYQLRKSADGGLVFKL